MHYHEVRISKNIYLVFAYPNLFTLIVYKSFFVCYLFRI